jgi:1-acyl-sn-glycerol-3-phosphate acyltransferase
MSSITLGTFAPNILPQHSSLVTRIYRSIRLIIHTLYGVVVASTVLPRVSARNRELIISRWSRKLLGVLNIKIVVTGKAPANDVTNVMFIANHISWIDIHALNSVRTVRFVAKSEIRHWPLFGWFAVKVNTLFTERERKQDAGRMVKVATESLKTGDCLCYFPEGTTTDGTEIKPFKSSLIQAAVNANSQVWPFAISYPLENGAHNIEMAYWGDISLFESMKMVIAQKSPVVVMDFLPPINPQEHDRRDLANITRQEIAEKLNLVA